MNLNEIANIVALLIGFPAFLSAALNLGKYFNWIKDGQAPTIILWANLVAFVAVSVAVYTGNLDLVGSVDNQLDTFAKFLVAFTTFVAELGLTKVAHVSLKGTPVIGHSFSAKKK